MRGSFIVDRVNVALRRSHLAKNDVALEEIPERGSAAADRAHEYAGAELRRQLRFRQVILRDRLHGDSKLVVLTADRSSGTHRRRIVLLALCRGTHFVRLLGELHLEILLVAVAHDFEIDHVARLVAAYDALQRADLIHRLAVRGDDHVADHDPGCWPLTSPPNRSITCLASVIGIAKP